MTWRVAQLLYLMMPAYCANMTPPFVRFWRGWNPPISARWLGSHKTVVGAAGGVLAAMVVALIQARLRWRGAIADYDRWPILGLLLGVGAIGGDAVKSFIKRRRGVAPGGRWIPFDQLDAAIGALVLVAMRVDLSWSDVAAVLAITFVGDIGVNQVAYRLGIRESAW